MPRLSRKNNESLFEEILTLVTVLPWWGGPLVAALVYVFLAMIVPAIFMANATDSPVTSLPFGVFSKVSVSVAPLAAGIILLVGAASPLKRWATGRALDTQTGAESLRELTWLEFERLLAEAFRREGYRVEPGGGSAPDGGVDLRLFREGRLILVQCKHWKVWKVGVKIVRELRGVMSSEGADGGIVVTSGKFSGDAVDFARASGIRLVDGEELLLMIRAVQRRPQATMATASASPVAPVVTPVAAPDTLTPACPKCGGVMVIRTARQGANAGGRFWGCSGYPRCRGIVNVVAQVGTDVR
ncbi:MAG: restriction endonuclease [Candidatus Hydrogenedentes bacterium]|nr:restriction endonuclease [Candidatus Hydrogenedentota bacterium]